MVQWYAFALLAAAAVALVPSPSRLACDRRPTMTGATPPAARACTVAASAWRRAYAAADCRGDARTDRRVVHHLLLFSARARGELRNAAADSADSRHRRDAAGWIPVPPRRIARALGAPRARADGIATLAASAGSTRRGRRERCRARSRIASCGSSCRRATPRLPPRLLAQHPGLVVVRVPASVAARAPRRTQGRFISSIPSAIWSCAIPDDPDIKGIARDLTRLLQASRIG